MFSKKDEIQEEANRIEKEAISSIISKGMHLSGEIRFEGKARLDGSVEGNIQGDYLIISETGEVNGDLDLDALICHGKVIGATRAKLVTAHATSFIQGKLEAVNLTVESGASLDGEIKVATKDALSDKEPAPGPVKKEYESEPES
jgi:cytoskeletal protein CcmA (bactofilin family)